MLDEMGAIVGPSGTGKSCNMRKLSGTANVEPLVAWDQRAVINATITTTTITSTITIAITITIITIINIITITITLYLMHFDCFVPRPRRAWSTYT